MAVLNQAQLERRQSCCWDAAVKGDARSWRFDIPNEVWEILDVKLNDDSAPTDVMLSDDQKRVVRDLMCDVVGALDDGPGFAVLDRVPMDRYSPGQATLAYWLIGQAIGRPIAQNVKGALLYDVTDKGADYSQGARFSITNAESTFHTDGAFAQSPPDYVGLLCLRTARVGGESQLVSAYTACAQLLESDPASLDALTDAFYFDRRGEHAADESPVAAFPVLADRDGELTVRYLDYYIKQGHEKAASSLSPTGCAALEAFEQTLRQANVMMTFSMERGQMLIVNNHWILHNRTAFEDHEDPALRRHYVRLWLGRD